MILIRKYETLGFDIITRFLLKRKASLVFYFSHSKVFLRFELINILIEMTYYTFLALKLSIF
jgi:hypothetical protein